MSGMPECTRGGKCNSKTSSSARYRQNGLHRSHECEIINPQASMKELSQESANTYALKAYQAGRQPS